MDEVKYNFEWYEKTNIIGLEGMSHLLTLSFTSEALEYGGPIGLLIVTPPGTGKSMLLTTIKYPRAIITNDITGRGLEDLAREMAKQVRGFVVVPDLLRVLARKGGAEGFLYLLNVLQEEGLVRIERYDRKERYEQPIQFSVVAAMTDEVYQKHLSQFEGSGFLSRNLVASYSYTKEDVTRIQEYIIHNGKARPFTLVRPAPRQYTFTEKIQSAIKKLGHSLARCRGDSYPFRAIKQVKKLVMAQALYDNSEEASITHVRKVACLFPFLLGKKFKSQGLSYATDAEYLYLRNLLLGEKNKVEEESKVIERLEKVELIQVDTFSGEISFYVGKRREE